MVVLSLVIRCTLFVSHLFLISLLKEEIKKIFEVRYFHLIRPHCSYIFIVI